MIKPLALLGLLLACSHSETANAISFEVVGPCSETPVYSGESHVDDLKTSVGKVSVDLFEQNKIPYDGSETGFRSILGTPTGMESIEVLSDKKMRAHGWCYTVDNIAPDVLPGDYFFTSNNAKLVWFYGYSTYDNGQWVDYCVPSWRVQAAQFCSK